MSDKHTIKVGNNCLGCFFLTRDEEGFGFYHCTHPSGRSVRPNEGRDAGNPPLAVRPSSGEHCPLLTKPVVITGGASSWPPDPPEPPMDVDTEFDKLIGGCPYCGRRK